MARAFAEIAFTPNVRAEQNRFGSADGYSKFLSADVSGGRSLTDREAEFIAARDGFYQATVSQSGWPYVQFRGGPIGFLHVLDTQTIAYADYRGNRQYISKGNLSGDDRISLILMDYPNRQRLKIWGKAQFIEGEAADQLLKTLHAPESAGRPERIVKISVEAFDWNCPAHIPQRFTDAEFAPVVEAMSDQIAKLTAENERLAMARKQTGEN